MTRVGMDVEAVRGLAGQLDHKAEGIRSLVREIEAVVHNLRSNWDGRDATQFADQWWPQHRNELNKAAEAIAGLSQSAKNNASEQEQVSNH